MATVHLISGLPCAGKSTYARRLKEQRNAVHMSLDYWLITAHGRYPIDTVGYDEHARRVYACRTLIWDVATEFLQRDVDVILDDGFFLRHDRAEHIESARKIGASAAIHFVDVPLDALRERLASRNRSPGPYHFEITVDALDGFVAFYEKPSSDEGAKLVLVDLDDPIDPVIE